MKIKYTVSDGYAGGDRPHYVTVDDDEIRDCETVEAATVLIWEAVEADFRENVSPGWNEGTYRNEIERLIAERVEQ